MNFRTCEFCKSAHTTPSYKLFCHCRTKIKPKGHLEVTMGHSCAKWEARDEKTRQIIESAEKKYGGA
jgi:hypothetical protein